MNTPVITAAEAPRAKARRKLLTGPVLLLALLLAGLAAAGPAGASTTAPGSWSPLLSPPAALLATLQGTFTGVPTPTMYDQVGTALAVSGDTAVVGAQYYQDTTQNPLPYARGRAYVSVRENGTWAQQDVLTAPDGMDASYFGSAVAIDGDTVVVGAYGHGYTAGSVYVFVRAGASWALQQELTGITHSELGWSVAVSGDTLIAGAPGYYPSDVGPVQGAAVVFTRSGATWTQQQQLTASDGADKDRFGWSVGLSGDCAVVGAPFRNGGIPNGAGAAYVFTRNAGIWSQQLEATGSANDNLGRCVAASGQTALAGAPGAGSYAGKAVVFADTGAGWAQQDTIAPTGVLPGDNAGFAVALDGDTALIGALGRTVGGISAAGEAYVLGRDGTSWTQQAQVDSPAPATQLHFGYAVAVDGDTMLAGEPSPFNNRDGHAYAYLLTPAVDTMPPVTTALVAPAGWTNKPVKVTLSATDDVSGVASTEYQVQGAAAWLTYTAPFQVTTQGVTTFLCHSTDFDGHLETPDVVFTVRRDTIGPKTLALANVTAHRGKSAVFRFRVKDLTPKATVWLKVFKGKQLKKTARLGRRATNSALRYKWKCRLARGRYTWKVFATDQAGNKQRSMTSKKFVVK